MSRIMRNGPGHTSHGFQFSLESGRSHNLTKLLADKSVKHLHHFSGVDIKSSSMKTNEDEYSFPSYLGHRRVTFIT
jgi:hypothetical protein